MSWKQGNDPHFISTGPTVIRRNDSSGTWNFCLSESHGLDNVIIKSGTAKEAEQKHLTVFEHELFFDVLPVSILSYLAEWIINPLRLLPPLFHGKYVIQNKSALHLWIKALSQVVAEFTSQVRMSYLDEGLGSLSSCFVFQVRDTVFSHHIVCKCPRNGNRGSRREFRDNGRNQPSVTECSGRSQQCDALTAIGVARTDHEVKLPPRAADHAMAQTFRSDLAAEIHHQRHIDSYHIGVLSNKCGVVRV